MNIAICDDEEACVEQVEKYLDRFARSHRNVWWESFYSAEELLKYYDNNGNMFDILITDIEMGEINGVKLANKIRSLDSGIVIFFLTSHDEYLRQCFKPAPLSFWDKPITYEKFSDDMEEAIKKAKDNRRMFSFKINERYIRIPYMDIVYFSIKNKTITIHALKQTYEFKGTFSEYEQIWKSAEFVQTLRSEFVNSYYIDSFNADEECIILTNGKKLRVSRGNIKRIKNELFKNDTKEYIKIMKHMGE